MGEKFSRNRAVCLSVKDLFRECFYNDANYDDFTYGDLKDIETISLTVYEKVREKREKEQEYLKNTKEVQEY